MPIEIRTARDDELDQVHFLLAYSFSGDRSDEGRAHLRHVEGMGPVFALFEDGEMAACLRIFSLGMLVNGASIPLGGISSVASLPEHRRRGLVGQLLRHALEVMRDQGQPLSALYTPHPALYRRYGWMVASLVARYGFNPKDVATARPARPRGRAHRASEEDWPALDEIYRRFTLRRTGYLDRSEGWWKEAIFRRIYDEKRRLNDIALWTDEQGSHSGYLVYTSARERRADGPDATKLIIDELISLDGDAAVGLLRYALAHDLANEVSWFGPPDEPLILALDDSRRVKRELWDAAMLRVVDVEKAVAARPPAAAAPEGAFTIHISDASAPWNQDSWRIECAGGRLAARRTDASAGLSTDAAAFAAMYNGFLKPSEAVRASLAEAADGNALALADAILATDYPPFAGDFF